MSLAVRRGLRPTVTAWVKASPTSWAACGYHYRIVVDEKVCCLICGAHDALPPDPVSAEVRALAAKPAEVDADGLAPIAVLNPIKPDDTPGGAAAATRLRHRVFAGSASELCAIYKTLKVA